MKYTKTLQKITTKFKNENFHPFPSNSHNFSPEYIIISRPRTDRPKFRVETVNDGYI